MPNFMKIREMRTKVFLADGRKDRHDEATSRFSQFCEIAQKLTVIIDMFSSDVSKQRADTPSSSR
jgi:hypothetical protein